MKIVHSVHILPDAVRLDGVALPVEEQGAELLSALYRAYVKDYPKFFKMDLLSKLGVIATELLVKDEPGRFTPREDRAVLLLSHSGPLCDDRNYQKTISGDDYFPSPALFVYTLANIVTGEIAIRNGYHGETSFYILPRQDDRLMQQILQASCFDSTTQSILCGWLDYEDDAHFVADLRILNKSVKSV